MRNTRPSRNQFQGAFYQNALCWSACGELFKPFPSISLFCFPSPSLQKHSACTEMLRWALGRELPIFSGGWHLRVNHLCLMQHLPLEYWLSKLQAAEPAFGFNKVIIIQNLTTLWKMCWEKFQNLVSYYFALLLYLANNIDINYFLIAQIQLLCFLEWEPAQSLAVW